MPPPDSACTLSAPRFRAMLPEVLAAMPDEPFVEVDMDRLGRWVRRARAPLAARW